VGKYDAAKHAQLIVKYGNCFLHALDEAIDTHSECVTAIVFPRHQWLNSLTAMLQL